MQFRQLRARVWWRASIPHALIIAQGNPESTNYCWYLPQKIGGSLFLLKGLGKEVALHELIAAAHYVVNDVANHRLR